MLLEGGRRCTKAAAWSEKFTDAIIDGYLIERDYETAAQNHLLSVVSDMCDPLEQRMQEEAIGIDDVSGEPISSELICKARAEELGGFRAQ